MTFLLGFILSYLLGSVPTAYIFGKWINGIDIREHGSGNVGATNVFRVLGKKPGIIVLVLDILKGVLPIVLIGPFLGIENIVHYIFLAVAAVSGHNWTIFLNFKGGKGIATSLGTLIGLTILFSLLRPVLFVCLVVWILVFLSLGYVSLASMIASIMLPIMMVLTNQPFELVLMGVVFCIFIIFRHRPNIQRLLSGKESRVKTLFCKKR